MSRKASQRYGQCYRKRKYPDRKEALDVLLEAHRRGVELGQPYRCPHGCGGWHIGHKHRGKRRRR